MIGPRRRIAVALLSALIGVACRTAPVLDVTNAAVPGGLTTDQVRTAILRAAAQRNWSVSDAGPGHLVASLQLRSHTASVDITYSERSYDVRYRDSTNLRYDGRRIHQNYNGWILNLRRSIDRELTGAARPGGLPGP